MRLLRPIPALLGLLLVSQDLHAHARLVWPTPRSQSDSLKTAPCGNVAPGTEREELVAGTQLEVSFEETINHPGWFRLALGTADDEGFDENIILDDIPHSNVGTATRSNPRPYDVTITVPNTPCEECTLQLIQVMTEGPDPTTTSGYPEYYSCADIRIVAGSSSGDGGAGGASSSSGGTTSSTSSGGGDSGGSDDNGGTGCSASGTAGLGVLPLLVLWRVRRRR
ncbi:MAG: SCE4755 family polysaccharide monooxygenase-like protein [Myxococcota bacterium]